MPHPTYAARSDAGHAAGHETVDQLSPRHAAYGVAVRDIFSGEGWSPAEPVRARDWHDIGEGTAVSTETAFD